MLPNLRNSALLALSFWAFQAHSQEDYLTRLFVNSEEGAAVMAASEQNLEFLYERKDNRSRPHHFHEMHEKPLHAIAISKDLNHFYHFHPEPSHHGSKPFSLRIGSSRLDDDNFQVRNGIRDGGGYYLFSEFMPMDEPMQLSRTEFQVEGAARRTQPVVADPLIGTNTIVKFFDSKEIETSEEAASFRAELKLNKFFACSVFLPHLTLKIQKRSTQNSQFEDLKELSTWLGTFGHAVLISNEGNSPEEKTLLHLHAVYPIPDEGPNGTRGPVIKLAPDSHGYKVPPGLYKTWIQFKKDSKVYTWSFAFKWDPETLKAQTFVDSKCL